MKVLPIMSEKQQKNLNKLMSKNDQIPEGLRNFLKKQINLLKKQELEKLRDQYAKLDLMMNQFEEMRKKDPALKMSSDKVKEFCTCLDEVLSIIKSNQKYCVELGGSLQAWYYSEFKWVSLLLSLPKITKFPKANQEQIKRSYKHCKENVQPNLKEKLFEQMEIFISEWGLRKNTEWTNLTESWKKNPAKGLTLMNMKNHTN